ncbi:pilus assembly protein TadG-related protein [Agromyces sp. Marseille-Q5079]|uniref:pilus assembly protein TadG-related protein n=1 Tax=Agromyces sp. Marseille-Q5079 TaxID=3439059 RepID=UPI003D9CA0B0
MRDDSGASAVLVAICLLVLVGFGALAVDVGAMYSERAQLQNAADAGALAAAEYCGGHGGCATTTSKSGAATAASAVTGGNMLDGSATLPPLTFTADTVTVKATTPGMEHPLAAAIGVASSDVGAAGTAQWIAAGASVVPFAIGSCKESTLTPGTVAYIPIDNAPCAGSVPGAFGWLDDGTTSCVKDVRIGEFTTVTTGDTGKCELSTAELAAAAAQMGCNLATIPHKYGTTVEKMFYCFVGRTVLVPVYNLASKCPGTPPAGKAYCIEKFAAFDIYGIHVKTTTGNKVDECKPSVTCHLPGSWGALGFEGRFVSYVTAADSWMLGPPNPSVRLVQ